MVVAAPGFGTPLFYEQTDRLRFTPEFIGWLGVVISAAAMVWMSLRERTVARWLGIVSLLPVLATVAMLVGLGAIRCLDFDTRKSSASIR